VLKVVGVTRANNVAIMLTRFQDFRDGEAICAAVLNGMAFSTERLSLLQQVSTHCSWGPLRTVGRPASLHRHVTPARRCASASWPLIIPWIPALQAEDCRG
jgi:hypothetical protein